MNKNNKAFTLVELIVVITILAILGTIAFISLQGYSRDARDSVRISDMKNIEKGFELEMTKNGKLLKPDDYVEITASGTVISYQGYAGQNVLNTIGVRGEVKDPLDKIFYTYVTNTKLNKYQILGYLESDEVVFNNDIIEVTNALDSSERFPTVGGNKLGVLLLTGSLLPVQTTGVGIDIINTTNDYKVYTDNTINGKVEGTGSILSIAFAHVINPIGSCNAILKNLNSRGDGVYTIDPEKNGVGFDVYCDMNELNGITDFLLGEGNFVNGKGLSDSSLSDVNFITSINGPISSNYAINQKGDIDIQYVIFFPDIKRCKKGDIFRMGAWVANNTGNIFHHNFWDTNINTFHIDGFQKPGYMVLKEKIVDGILWQYQQVEGEILHSLYNFEWYLGYYSEDPKDFYFTGIRLSCLKQ